MSSGPYSSEVFEEPDSSDVFSLAFPFGESEVFESILSAPPFIPLPKKERMVDT